MQSIGDVLSKDLKITELRSCFTSPFFHLSHVVNFLSHSQVKNPSACSSEVATEELTSLIVSSSGLIGRESVSTNDCVDDKAQMLLGGTACPKLGPLWPSLLLCGKGVVKFWHGGC